MSAGNAPRNVLVTGGRGFIGVNLVRRLVETGARVRVLDDLSLLPDDPTRGGLLRDGAGAWHDGAELVRADVRDLAAVCRAAVGADAIVHLAANSGVQQSVDDPMADMDVNVRGTLTCLEAARRASVPRFLFASSGAPLGGALPPVSEATLPRPLSPYGASKLSGEAYCSAYTASFGVACAVLRFSNVYGPHSTHKTSVVGQFLRRAMAGEPWEIYGDGGQTRDFIHVRDLVAAIVAGLSARDIGGEVLHVASGVETPILTLAERLATLIERAGRPRPEMVFQPPRVGDMARSRADISKAAAVLGWRPAIPLEDGLAETVAWFLETHG